MKLNSKIYVAGHMGLVGSAVLRNLQKNGYRNIIFRTKDQLNLEKQNEVKSFFNIERPEYVILGAAKVGGIFANSQYPADFFYTNISIQTNVLNESYLNGIKRLLFLGSSCIYPKNSDQPIKEEYLLSGLLEETNRAYSVAKIAGIEMCWSYNRQFSTNYLGLMPTNLYGINDNFSLDNSHVIPALIRKFHDAKINKEASVILWGSGNQKREFLFSDDLADACILLLNLEDERFTQLINEKKHPIINIGSGEEIKIKDLAILIAKIIGYKGLIHFNNKLEGTAQKYLNSERINNFNWRPKVKLKDGLELVYQSFLNQNI
jgi:GDP-L-fucose synthase